MTYSYSDRKKLLLGFGAFVFMFGISLDKSLGILIQASAGTRPINFKDMIEFVLTIAFAWIAVKLFKINLRRS